MKNKLIFLTMLALFLVGSVSFADDDADKKRLLKEYDKMQKEKIKEEERLAKEKAAEEERLAKEKAEIEKEESKEATNEVTEVAVEEPVTQNETVVVEEVEKVPEVSKRNMTESEKMDVEVQRIKKRMLEINDKIENYHKTNEMIDNLEKNVKELERKVNY